ncbi:hypothetical protein [Mesorhizobium marinum]|uniref:hypothetical protein n=1 Tax=Mesorhizobium marinum TaxID=3228790 RepID=UPI0034666387
MHGTIVPPVASRIVRKHNDWTLKEHEVVMSHWPEVDAIKQRLPHRTVGAIWAFAAKCNLKTSRHVWTAPADAKMRKLAADGCSRVEIAKALGLTAKQVGRRAEYTRTAIRRRPPAPSRNPLVDAVRQRAFDLNMSLIDLDRSLGDRKIFQHAAGNQNVKHVHIRAGLLVSLGDCPDVLLR